MLGKRGADFWSGVFSVFKRGMRGVYQHCDEKHLHRYLAEIDCHRSRLGIEDAARTEAAIKGVSGKRVTGNLTELFTSIAPHASCAGARSEGGSTPQIWPLQQTLDWPPRHTLNDADALILTNGLGRMLRNDPDHIDFLPT